MTARTRRASAWRGIYWSEVQPGQQVWLRGSHNGKFRAYGPHTVNDPKARTLISGTPGHSTSVFTHYSEDLLVPAPKTCIQDHLPNGVEGV